jgi:hypothetical protein
VRNPIVMVLIAMVCFPYALFVMYSELNELKAFRQKDDFNPILCCLLWIVFVWGMPDKIMEAKQMAGVPNPQVSSPILYFLLAPYFLTLDLNQIWEAAGGARQLPPG